MTVTAAWMRGRLAALGVQPGLAAVGVSGGPDSLALLHLLHGAAPAAGLSLLVLHADHGIQAGSELVAGRVAALARTCGLPFEVGHLRLGPGAGEGAARRARYRWFREVLQRTGARHLFLAHHRDDQVETILMRVLAGSGPAGLAGMAPRRGRVVRPLLALGRDDLAAVVALTGWEAWTDPSNLDPRHTRGWLRGTLLPLLASHDPAVAERLLRLGAQAAADRQAWQAALDLLPGLDLRVESPAVSVAATPLSGYDSALARGVLRALVRRAGAVADAVAVERLLALARSGTSGRWVPLGGRWRGEIAFGRLRIGPGAGAPPPAAMTLETGAAGSLGFGRWAIRWGGGAGAPPWRRDGWGTRVIPGVYTVRAWQPGDRIRPLAGRGSRLVVRCLQDARVARSERAGWPVVVAGSGEVAWVPGVCRGTACLPAEGEEGVGVDVEQS